MPKDRVPGRSWLSVVAYSSSPNSRYGRVLARHKIHLIRQRGADSHAVLRQNAFCPCMRISPNAAGTVLPAARSPDLLQEIGHAPRQSFTVIVKRVIGFSINAIAGSLMLALLGVPPFEATSITLRLDRVRLTPGDRCATRDSDSRSLNK